MKDFIFKASNKNTKVKIEDDKIIVERAGIDFAAQRAKGTYEFYYSDIIKLRFKEAGLLSFGYLLLITKGNEKIQDKNLVEICSGDISAILFKRSENFDVYKLKEIIEERLKGKSK